MKSGQKIDCYTLKNVAKRYDQREVLRVDELALNTGEILALVGPSGAGKSTLLRLLAFLEQPDEGTISWQGRPVDGRWPDLESRRQVTMVFQQPRLLKRTVLENIGYGLQLRGQDVAKNGRLESLCRDLGIYDLLDQKSSKLSGGEQQRVALARALILEPQVLILDEPTSNLDPQNIALVEKMIERDNAERGTTVVVVTHNIFQAKRLSHRTGLILNGRLQDVSDTASFFDNPRNEETRRFISGEIVY